MFFLKLWVLKKRRLFWSFIGLLGLLLGVSLWAGRGVEPVSGSLVINEVMAANQTGLKDEDGDYSDWLEIYNPGYLPVNLSGWTLSDDPDQPDKWRFPNLSLGSGEYLLVFASGKNRAAARQSLHTNFGLQREGEFLGLYNILDQQWVDVIEASQEQFQDVAYGRYETGWGYLSQPTPGQANDATLLWADVVAPVEASAGRGFYEAPFQVELKTATPGAVIYYTLDGNEPTEAQGIVYGAPIPVEKTTLLRAAAFKPDFRASSTKTYSYIFLNEVLAQPANPPGFPETWGVYRQTYKNAVEGQPVKADYGMDPEIVNDPRYRESLKEDLQSIPSLSLVMAPQSFDIYLNPRERGPEWERPVSVELFDPARPEWGFQINGGVRVQGDLGREEYIPKHSFRLFFRSEYGPGQLHYPLFPDSPVDIFDTLVLRGGVQGSYVSPWDPRRLAATYAQDEWLRASQIEMSGVGSHGIFVHLYLNGLYWGLYNVVERPDEAFASAYFNLEKEAWYAFNHSGVVNGDEAEIRNLLKGLGEAATPEERYALVSARLNTAQFADYVILNWYAGTHDWPNNNWYAGFHYPDGKINYFVWDGELIWENGAQVDFGISNPPGHLWPNTVEPLFKALLPGADFRIELADRLYKQLFNDGPLTDANAQARWRRLNNIINRAIVGESARWGDTQQEPPLDREAWLRAVDNVLKQMEGNGQKQINQMRELGYYPPVDPPVFNQQGGVIQKGFELVLSNPNSNGGQGAIYYTLNGVDPRVKGTGAVAPEAILYHQPVALTATTQLKARLLTGDTWSALNEATFSFVPQDYRLRFTEIMYNPAESEDLEFVELQNMGALEVKLAGMSFEGIQYNFPADTPPLSPGATIVLVRDAVAFAERYPGVVIGGVYEGQLANQGENLLLKDQQGQPVILAAYDDENGWPLSADGRGDSLILVEPEGDPAHPKSYRASPDPGGSPGKEDPLLFASCCRR